MEFAGVFRIKRHLNVPEIMQIGSAILMMWAVKCSWHSFWATVYIKCSHADKYYCLTYILCIF